MAMSLLRFITFVAVALPLIAVQAVLGWMHLWWLSVLIGLVAGGIAWGVDELYKHLKSPLTSPAAEKTSADLTWEHKMTLKRAIASENRGDWDKAIPLFEQVIKRDNDQENIQLARRHLEAIRNRGASQGGA